MRFQLEAVTPFGGLVPQQVLPRLIGLNFSLDNIMCE